MIIQLKRNMNSISLLPKKKVFFMLVNPILHIENIYACTPCKIHLTKEMGKTSTMYLLMQPVDQRCIRNFGQ